MLTLPKSQACAQDADDQRDGKENDAANLGQLCQLGVNAALFAVFFFDLDGKLLFYVVEPTLKKHYDNMPRRDMTKMPYEMNKPNYEYNV